MAKTRVIPKDVNRRLYSVLVENEPGVLARIAGLFSARGFNISSLAVGETLDPEVSRMTIAAEGTALQLDQINKQLNKLIPVISVKDLHEDEYVSRELLLIKIGKSDKAREYMKKNRAEHQWKLIDESPEHFIIQVTVSGDEVAAVLKDLKPFGVDELCRTGQIAMSKKYRIGVTGSKEVKVKC